MSSFKNSFQYDLWAEEEPPEDPQLYELKKVQLNLIGQDKKKVPCHRYQKPSLVPGVEVPDAGASYNPNEKDHHELLMKAASIEQKKRAKELKLKKAVKSYYVPKNSKESHELWMQEMSAGLNDEYSNEEEEEDEVEEDSKTSNALQKCKAPERKTNSQRNKERQQKLIEAEKQTKLDEKRRKATEPGFKKMVKQLKKREKDLEERQKVKEVKRRSSFFTTKKLSGIKFTPADVEVSLETNRKQPMRKIAVEGNLLEDRFKSLQKRNMLESRQPLAKNHKLSSKRKVKRYTKRSHRVRPA